MGAVLHTVNPRLFPEQVEFIVNHAADKLMFVDPLILPLVEKLRDRLATLEQIVVLTDEAHMPKSSIPGLTSYEAFIEGQPDTYHWPALDERTASALCYTSGTTGNPKGVLYNHRSTLLHALGSSTALRLGPDDVAMPIVPMFHANAWGWPYVAPMMAAKLVFPGPKMGDGAAIARLIQHEKVTVSAGVPTVWQNLLNHARSTGESLAPLNRVLAGGSAVPLAIINEFRERHGIAVYQGWGMTEMSPLGTVNGPWPGDEKLSPAELDAKRAKAGHPVFGVDMKIVDDDNNELPWDGRTSGALKVRGPWICSGYFHLERDAMVHDDDGWFATGDVAAIEPGGMLVITDRAKDVIKSGGEWISSIEIENVACGHPGVMQAAVIGRRHPKWDERPLLIVIPRPDAQPTREELLKFFEGKVAKWWIPDDVAFVERIPLTATGKIAKLELRKQFADYSFPGTG
jgi:fatty-acyl-CoA synthase